MTCFRLFLNKLSVHHIQYMKRNSKMHFVLLTITVLASCFSSVFGQSECLTPKGVNGTCIPIDQCHSLLKILKNRNITQRDLEFLKESQCVYLGTTPEVCCPQSCITPASDNGTCVSIYSCPSLAKLLEPPLSKENMQYVRDSRCNGWQEGTVCCPPNGPTVTASICAATMSALPIHPRTDCCGVESAIGHVNKVGARTTIYQYPWLVGLEYFVPAKNELQIRAAGSLISARYVLTAGQCVTGLTVRETGPPVNVRLGDYEITNSYEPDCVLTKDGVRECNDGMIRIDIERHIPHPDYNTTRGWAVNDIALIMLKQNAPFTDFIRPICLPSTDLSVTPPPNFIMFVAGWGETISEGKNSKVKLQVDLPFIDNDRCQTAYQQEARRNISLTSGHLCAGGVAGKDTCRGDAGAPLMYLNGKASEVVGLVSIGLYTCGRDKVPSVYTKVYEYLPWIRNTINIDLTLFANDDDT